MLDLNNDLEKLSVNKEHLNRLKEAEYKKRIEAILFSARRILSIKEIKNHFDDLTKQKLVKLTRDLIDEYNNFSTALEIVELSDVRFQLKIKDPIINSIDKFIHGKHLRRSTIKTLAVIVYLQPEATRKALYKVRGRSSTVYRNIRTLIDKDFIKEVDRTFYLTRTFYDYFQLKKKDPSKAKKILQAVLQKN